MLWGSGFLFVKLALRGLSPAQVVLGQLAFGALVLLLTLAVRRQPLPHAAREWAYLAGMAVLANIAPYLLFSWSEQRISSGFAGALSGTTPLVTLLLARAFGVGRLTLARVLGLALGLAGVVLLAAPWHDGHERSLSLGSSPRWAPQPAMPAPMCMHGGCSPIEAPNRSCCRPRS